MNEQVLYAFKEFLSEKGVLNEFCEAFLKSDCEIRYYKLIDSFNWGDARKRQNNNIPWTIIEDEWQDVFQSLGLGLGIYTYNEISDYKADIARYLTESKTNKMLKHISRVRDNV